MFKILPALFKKPPIPSRTVIQPKTLTDVETISRQACCDFNSQFPKTKSNTYVAIRLYQYMNRVGIEKRCAVLRKVLKKLNKINRKFREKNFNYGYHHCRTCLTPQGYDKTIMFLKSLIKKKRFANCGCRADVVQEDLFHRGINTQKFNVKVFPEGKRLCNDHEFLLFGLDQNCDIHNPKTWGKNALVIDPYFNLVAKAEDALKFYKKVFRFKPKKDKMIFDKTEQVNMSDYLKYHNLKAIGSVEA